MNTACRWFTLQPLYTRCWHGRSAHSVIKRAANILYDAGVSDERALLLPTVDTISVAPLRPFVRSQVLCARVRPCVQPTSLRTRDEKDEIAWRRVAHTRLYEAASNRSSRLVRAYELSCNACPRTLRAMFSVDQRLVPRTCKTRISMTSVAALMYDSPVCDYPCLPLPERGVVASCLDSMRSSAPVALHPIGCEKNEHACA